MPVVGIAPGLSGYSDWYNRELKDLINLAYYKFANDVLLEGL